MPECLDIAPPWPGPSWPASKPAANGASRRRFMKTVCQSGPRIYTNRTRNVYDWCMAKVRTNIEVEDDDVRAIMDRYGVHTKTEAVNLALRHLAGQPMSRQEALGMRGAHAIEEVDSDTSPRGGA